MKLSRTQINIMMARECMSVTELARRYGVSRSRINIILNSKNVTPSCAGRLSQALGCDVTEIIDEE